MRAYKTSQDNWQLNFTIDGVQKTLCLGKNQTALSSERISKVVTELVNGYRRGEPAEPETVRKIKQFPKRIQKSLERFGLFACKTGISMSGLYEKFEQSILHFSEKTRYNYNLWLRHLIKYFGERQIETITHEDALQFYYAVSETMAEATASRGIRYCVTIFKYAQRTGLLIDNPFCGIKQGSDTNEERQYYVTREKIETILQYCQDDRERLMVVLARFGGLRIPSELRELKCGDVTETTIRVSNNTKTGFRAVPLFREIKEVFDRLPKGLAEERIFGTNYSRSFCRDHLLAAIERSGVKCWPKPFINMRSSCITDLDELGYSEKVLDAIFGNSAAVRKKHYVQFQMAKEYRRVLDDNSAIVDFLRNNGGRFENGEKDLSLQQILLLGKNLVSRFGAENLDTLLSK